MPLSLEYSDAHDRSSRVGAIEQSGVKILLVDDDRDLVETLALRLHSAGFTPVPACSPAAAIQRFERERVDLAVLDVEIGPWSGLDLLEELRKRSQVPILMLTGCAFESVEARSFALGADDYLQKPISTSSLIARISAVLTRYRRAQEQAEVHVQLNAALRELVEARDRALAAAGQADRARDEGLALAAHDLLEPLTIIKSVAQLRHGRSVQMGTPDSDPLVQALAQIEANASKMARQLVELLGGRQLHIGQVLELHRTPTAGSLARRHAVPESHQRPPLPDA